MRKVILLFDERALAHIDSAMVLGTIDDDVGGPTVPAEAQAATDLLGLRTVVVRYDCDDENMLSNAQMLGVLTPQA